MKHKVLVIDDSRTFRQYAMEVLDQAGFTALGASNGVMGLRLIEKYEPEVVLLDIIMPGLSGLDVLRSLRQKKVLVSILLLTSKSGVAEIVAGLNAGADDYIVKPFENEELVARVRIAARRIALERNLVKLVEVRTRDLVKKERQAIFGQMVQGIVHNLRGPLMAVSGWAEMARMKIRAHTEPSGEGLIDNSQELLEGIMRDLDNVLLGVEKMKSLIDSLLMKSRYEALGQRQKINLNQIIEREIEFLDADRDLKHGVRKTLNLDPSIPEMWGIYTDYSQVIYNLVKNASDAMRNSSNKELTISTRHDDENVYVEFQDTGVGIPSGDLERIFDPFFTTKRYKESKDEGERDGTGLGLYTCVQLMKAYDADISVKSKVGVGSIFTLTIPKKNTCR